MEFQNLDELYVYLRNKLIQKTEEKPTLIWRFVGLMLYYQVNIFVVGNNISTSGDKAIEKYYHVESKDNRLEFTLKEPSLYSTVLADNVAVPILHEDEQEYQVEYNNRIYKIDK